MVASRVEIGTPRGYLKPYLDTIRESVKKVKLTRICFCCG